MSHNQKSTNTPPSNHFAASVTILRPSGVDSDLVGEFFLRQIAVEPDLGNPTAK
jgi:hypothetical protein